MLSLQQKAVAIVNFLSKRTEIPLDCKNNNNENLLDFYCKKINI